MSKKLEVFLEKKTSLGHYENLGVDGERGCRRFIDGLADKVYEMDFKVDDTRSPGPIFWAG